MLAVEKKGINNVSFLLKDRLQVRASLGSAGLPLAVRRDS